MPNRLVILLLVIAAALAAAMVGLRVLADRQSPQTKGPTEMNQQPHPIVVMETSKGPIRIELRPDKAPVTVGNFLRYVEEGLYDGTIFHRVIPNFMIQGGGFTPEMSQKPTREPIRNEAGNGLKNLRGTVAMARTNKVDSATAQFFINVADNPVLDHKNSTPEGFGYAVFGRVLEGMDVVDEIRNVPTGSVGGHEDVPLEPVVIASARRLQP